MESQPLPRKLTAILYADVAGYSRLTGEDEEGTHRRLREYLDLFSDSVASFEGRVIHYAGDAVLADFEVISNALICAASVQRDIASRNEDTPDDRKVQFRIGVNLGEVIVDGNEIYGDGVNVAARLESLADPGGICVSESVQTAIGTKLPLNFESMGEQPVKNIAKPVRAYRVLSAPGVELPEPSITLRRRRKTPRAGITVAAVIAVVLVGLLYWLAPWSFLDGISRMELNGGMAGTFELVKI